VDQDRDARLRRRKLASLATYRILSKGKIAFERYLSEVEKFAVGRGAS
jgi:hypothetical protein